MRAIKESEIGTTGCETSNLGFGYTNPSKLLIKGGEITLFGGYWSSPKEFKVIVRKPGEKVVALPALPVIWD